MTTQSGIIKGTAYLANLSGNMLYMGTPGEWVIQRPAVRHYGGYRSRVIPGSSTSAPGIR